MWRKVQQEEKLCDLNGGERKFKIGWSRNSLKLKCVQRPELEAHTCYVQGTLKTMILE